MSTQAWAVIVGILCVCLLVLSLRDAVRRARRDRKLGRKVRPRLR